MLIAALVGLLAIIGYFGVRMAGSGTPVVEGVESMPPELREAYTGQAKSRQAPPQTP